MFFRIPRKENAQCLHQLLPQPKAGMVLLWGGLGARWVKREQVEGAAWGLLGLLNLFFIPPGVGIMVHW